MKCISTRALVSNEFFKRELGLEIVYVDNLEQIIHSGIRILILLDEDFELWSHWLTEFDKEELTVIFIGSETLDKRSMNLLGHSESVKRIFIQYWTPLSLLSAFRSTLALILDFPRIFLADDFWISLARGARRFLKVIQVPQKDKFIYLPLGYTDNFVSELRKLGLVCSSGRDSLLKRGEFKLPSSRDSFTITFMGYSTGKIRSLILDGIQRKYPQETIFQYTEKWGQGNSSEPQYASLLLRASIALNPPGHVSNETFRYLEALICGAIPVSSVSSPQDWSRNPLAGLNSVTGNEFSYRKIIMSLRCQSSEKLELINEKLLTEYSQTLNTLKISLAS